MGKPDTIFLIDGSALLYRSFYGIAPLRTQSGIPTQAIYGFFRAIKRLVEKHNARRIVIAWDEKGSIRKKEYAQYKAKRLTPPSELLEQKKYIIKIAEKMGIFQVSLNGYEADDLIATIAKKYSKTNPIVVVASDKDLLQLISKNVTALDLAKKQTIDKVVFFEKYGFVPEKLSFYHALVGDSSDNIPGVKGIGKKSAEKIVKEFDDLKDLYKRLDEVSSNRTKNLLEDGKSDAALSFKLFTLRSCPIKMRISDTDFSPKQWGQADNFFAEFEMFSLASNPSAAKKEKKNAAKKVGFDWKLVTQEKQLFDIASKIKSKKFCAVDTETTGLNWCTEELIGISLAYDEKTAFYVPVLGEYEKKQDAQQEIFDVAKTELLSCVIDLKTVVKILGPILKTAGISKVMHNAKFDMHFLRKAGLEVCGDIFDTMIAAKLLQPEWQKAGLKGLSRDVLNEEMEEFKNVAGKKTSLKDVPIEKVAQYAAHDALQTFKLWNVFKPKLSKNADLKKIFYEIEISLCRILFEMESCGILLDPSILKKLDVSVKGKLERIEAKIRAAIKGSAKKD
ncbi:hypothetical protein KAU11_04455, partial [Candidatus Babeliales bacterium]|nr:hypothetical protein [Candidatus Babeliales bacterium]